ncbi:hypothetical protein [Paenibacillus sp. JSM ZJ436]
MSKQIDDYFEKTSREQLIIDLFETDSINFFENAEEIMAEYREIIKNNT